MAQKFHAQVPPCLPIYANVVTARQQMCRHRTSHSGRQATAPRTSITDVLAVRPARHYHRMLVRSEGLEPPRFYSLPPQGSASTNSATSAFVRSARDWRRTGSTARDVTNRGWGDKACEDGAKATGCPAISAAFA